MTNKNLSRKNIFIGTAITTIVVFAAQTVLASATWALLPLSDGAYLGWTPKTGSAHYAMVDESACNGTTDYNFTNTVGARDSYGVTLASIPNGSTITSLEITPCASNNKSGGQSSTMNIFYRWNGVDSAPAGTYVLTGTTPTALATTAFNGLSFVKGPTSNLEVGTVLSSGNKGARLSRVAVVVTYTIISAPSDLDAINISENQNNLTWTDTSSNEDGFKIERSMNSEYGPFSQVATTSANTTSYSDVGLVVDQTYYYRIRAFNSGGNSSYSNTDSAITGTTVPSDPLNLTATASSSSAVLNWTDTSSNEEGFKVERSSDDINFTEIATQGMNYSFYVDPGLTAGTYYYRVRAFNAAGDSGYSSTTSVTIF